MLIPKTLCRSRRLLSLLAIIATGFPSDGLANDFDEFLKPLLAQKCAKCHGEKKVEGDVNFKKMTSARHFLQQPKLIKSMIDAIDINNMPPETEPELNPKTRTRLLASLKTLLRQATAGEARNRLPMRRLNRFQYNNTVKDLFQLKLDVFKLPEKLMTRHGNYLHAKTGRMPATVNVASYSLSPQGGLRNVIAFPKDLRASHGFDNQANQLTLSPLLFDAFLRLSVSILDSPDFNKRNVGIWNDFFKEPQREIGMPAEVRRRLGRFLRFAFRGPVSDETLTRYTAYTMSRLGKGMSFTDSMRKVASAVLSSPMFLFRSSSAVAKRNQFELASNLSYFLWSSCPDKQLLTLAERGELAKPDVLNKTIERMFADPKIERFLDTFPSQWMQLENVLAATPDPQQNRFFSLDKKRPASLQMVLEPLLLFDAIFIEDRPIIELIAPSFSYRSEFLKTWYTSDLTPPTIDTRQVVDNNRRNSQRRSRLQTDVKALETKLAALIQPVKARLLATKNRNGGTDKAVDLRPYAAWEFNGDLRDSVKSLSLKSFGNIQYKDGMVVLNKAYLRSANLPINLKAKTLEVWCKVHNLNQRGGGVMGIQGPGDFFDTIVLGERKSRHWISGSNGFSRTEDFRTSTPETNPNQLLHLAMVYQADGTTTLYRNGKPYGRPFRKGSATFPKGRSSVIFGLRHLPAGGNKFLTVSLDKARLYDRALTAAEVAASSRGDVLYISDGELLKALSPEQKTERNTLKKTLEQSRAELKRIPQPQDLRKVQQTARRKFDDDLRTKMRSQVFKRMAVSDPRYGGVITNAAMLSMTSGPKRTHPIARGAWMTEVIFNDPPPPPPNDIPPLADDASNKNLTVRERFAVHRNNASCAGCHSKLDPLGFALENFDITGRWRDKYPNGKQVDASGTLIRKHRFDGIVAFKSALVKEKRRFAKAFAGHLLRYAASRELTAVDSLTLDEIVEQTAKDNFKLKSVIREVILKAYRPSQSPGERASQKRRR